MGALELRLCATDARGLYFLVPQDHEGFTSWRIIWFGIFYFLWFCHPLSFLLSSFLPFSFLLYPEKGLAGQVLSASPLPCNWSEMRHGGQMVQ